MEKAIRRVIQNMISEPELKTIIENELDKHNKSGIEEEFDFLLEPETEQKLSRVLIDENGQLFLTDYNNIEIEIQGFQARTVYILHLLCPRGIPNLNLGQYKDQLKSIYMEICKHKLGDEYRAENMIGGLLDRKSGINDATNKIRKALQQAITDDEVYNYYVISGKRNGKRRILLPKHKIKIENKVLREIKDSICNIE